MTRQVMGCNCNSLRLVWILQGVLFTTMATTFVTAEMAEPKQKDPTLLDIACNARDGGTSPLCSFRVVEGEITFRVCEYDGDIPTICWQVSVDIEELPDSVDPRTTLGENSLSTSQQKSKGDPAGAEGHEVTETVRYVSPQKDELGGSTKRHRETITEQDSVPLQTGQSTATAKISDVVQVGEYTYHPPYQTFGREIQKLLQHPRYDEVGEEARWLHSFGIAFQQLADERVAIGMDSDPQIDDLVKRAVAAFQEALLRYKEGIVSAPDTTSFTSLEFRLKQAVVYMDLAQTYQLSFAYSQQSGMDYLKQAESELRVLYDTTVSTKIGTAQFAVELVMAYAEVSLRLGAALLQGTNGLAGGGGLDTAIGGIAAAAEEWLLLQAGDDAETLLQNPKKIESMIKSYIPPLVAKVHQVITYFMRSKTLWWNMLLGESNVKPRLASTDAQQAMLHYATTLQNLGNAWLALEQYEPAVLALEEAWRLQDEMILPQMTSPSHETERSGMLVAMGENLYSLADVYLRMGEYEKALDRYKRSMDWFRRHNVASPNPTQPHTLANDEEMTMIQTYEQALEEYHAMFADGVDTSDPVVSDANGFYSGGDADYGTQTFYQRDDGYEGDLHNTLGALYLNAGDYDQAATHLQQALRLYLKVGEGQDATTATTYTQLALLYFQQGDYDASTEQHSLAIQIYKKIVTPGSNPLNHGGVPIVDWPNLLAESLQDLPDVYSDLPAALDIEALVEPSGETPATVEPAATGSSTDTVHLSHTERNKEEQPSKKAGQQSEHKIHIDLAAFSEAQANETISDEL